MYSCHVYMDARTCWGRGGHWMRNRGNAHEYINDDLCTDDARFDGRFDIIV